MREYRTKRGFGQKHFQGLLEAVGRRGFSHTTISNIEAGKRLPVPSLEAILVKYLNIPPGVLEAAIAEDRSMANARAATDPNDLSEPSDPYWVERYSREIDLRPERPVATELRRIVSNRRRLRKISFLSHSEAGGEIFELKVDDAVGRLEVVDPTAKVREWILHFHHPLIRDRRRDIVATKMFSSRQALVPGVWLSPAKRFDHFELAVIFPVVGGPKRVWSIDGLGRLLTPGSPGLMDGRGGRLLCRLLKPDRDGRVTVSFRPRVGKSYGVAWDEF